MKINITNLKYELNKYNTLVEEYEDIYLNMYNEYSNCSFFWYDINAKNFFNEINLQKIDMQKVFEEFSSIGSIYDYIVSSYEQFGKEIYYEKNAQGEIKTNINEYINKLQKIINQYNNINTTKYPEVSGYIKDEKSKLNYSLEQAKSLYNIVNTFYKETERIEKDLKSRISKIKIEYIKENNISDYV